MCEDCGNVSMMWNMLRLRNCEHVAGLHAARVNMRAMPSIIYIYRYARHLYMNAQSITLDIHITKNAGDTRYACHLRALRYQDFFMSSMRRLRSSM